MNDSELMEIHDPAEDEAVTEVKASGSEDKGKSHSQEKREKRRKEVAQARRRAKTASVVGYICLAVAAALVIWGVVVLVMKQMDKVTPNENYSSGLDNGGYIEGVKASDRVTLPDYSSVSVPYSEIEYTDESIDSDIESLLSGYTNLNTESGTVKDGDDVDIAYVGTVDGEEFSGGSSESTKVTIGSGTFIDDFEQQLIGANVGDTLEINVTFPEGYKTEELSGKDAVFTVDINGIYEPAVFDDDFVKTNLSEYAQTTDEYREYLRSDHEKDNLETYLMNWLKDNTTVNSYPSKYVKTLKGIQMYDDQQSYEYMNQFYSSYYGTVMYNSFEEYVGTSMDEYYQTLKDKAKETCKENMIYQAIVEREGVTVDGDYYKAYLVETGQDETYYDTLVASSGEPFVLQQAIAAKALEIVKGNVTIEK